ncbi:PREDICTED: uncharacterized protein LOC108534643 [Rhinopithecus bieti]|uniref:uncharacterized protein LOC108534643 n=1 Tax=Rhinopithecus bieti TaxID=61621 RepID=UPI00083BFDD1|nr:PREDICTED: uncharacterized protein LOC108534643 [Rhinopithecus bieti]
MSWLTGVPVVLGSGQTGRCGASGEDSHKHFICCKNSNWNVASTHGRRTALEQETFYNNTNKTQDYYSEQKQEIQLELFPIHLMKGTTRHSLWLCPPMPVRTLCDIASMETRAMVMEEESLDVLVQKDKASWNNINLPVISVPIKLSD